MSWLQLILGILFFPIGFLFVYPIFWKTLTISFVVLTIIGLLIG